MKKKQMRLTFCKGDFAAIVLVAALAVLTGTAFFYNIGSPESTAAVVYRNGRMIKELSLGEDGEYLIEGRYRNKIIVADGKVSIAESDCPGNDCVHSGWINEAGRTIVCLPNRLEIRIEGTSEVDFVVR